MKLPNVTHRTLLGGIPSVDNLATGRVHYTSPKKVNG